MKKRIAMKLLAVALAVMLVLSFAGCSASQGETVESLSTLDQILERGTLRVGVGVDGVPMHFYDENGEWTGYDVDWAKKMAEELGVELELVEVNGETRLSGVSSGRIDCAIACCTGNLERAKTVSFSIPYIINGMKMLTRADSPYETLEDLNSPECKVVVERATTSESLVEEFAPLAERIYVESFSEEVLQVEQGKADAMLHENTAVDYVAKNSNGALKAHDKSYSSDPICIVLPKGDEEWIRWVDMFVSWQITQGFQRETHIKWFGTEPAELTTIW